MVNKDDTPETNSFFSSGAYGCVHYPRIKCNGTQKKINDGKRKDGLVSKLVIYDSKSKNEYLLGKKLKPTDILKNNPIVVVERKCDIKTNAAKNIMNKYKKCKRVLDRKRDKKYKHVLFFSKYYKSITAKDYIYENFSIKKMVKYFYFCIYISNILKSFGVVHNDMHMNNVLYDEKKGNFHLIDFGLAIDLDNVYVNMDKNKINYKYLKGVLVEHEVKWLPSSIEHHILNHFVYSTHALNSIELMNIINIYYNELKAKPWILGIEDYDSYKKEIYDYYSELFLTNGSTDKHISEIIFKSTYSWDVYRAAISCLNIIESFHYDKMDIFNLSELKKILRDCLHYNYNIRTSPEKLLKKITSLSLL
mgnify:CR=1 FL=1